jgi:hypothetical protein
MDPQQFLQQAITKARMSLNYTQGESIRAIRVTLQIARDHLGPALYSEAIEALGGDDAVVAQITAALTEPFSGSWDTWYRPSPLGRFSREDIEAQIAFDHEHGPTIP